MESIAAMVLAAGGSSRMGRAKQLLQIDGESLVRRITRAAIHARCKPIVVVTGADADAVAKEISDLRVESALNPQWSNGMGGSIRCGLAAILKSDPNIEAAAVLLCDQALLDAEVLRNLIASFSDGGKPMAACRYGNTIGPPCCFAKSMFADLLRLPDSQGAKRLLLARPSDVTALDWPQGESDLDTPADWQRFCKRDSGAGNSRP